MKFLCIVFFTCLLISCGGTDEETTEETTASESETDTLTESVDTLSDTETVEEADPFANCEVEFTAYLYDPDPSGFTNIRKSRGGDLSLKLNRAEDEYGEFFLNLVAQKDGWFKIEDKIPGMDNDYEIPGGVGWIHGSLCHVGTRNYGGSELKLYSEADEGSDVLQRFDEEWGFTLKRICGDWVQVKGEFDGKVVVGWIQSEWLCGNPVTTCS